MVIISRVYNGCDSGINLNLPKKLRDLGVLAIPLDCLPLDDTAPDEEVLSQYWRYGQRFLTAAKILRDDPRLFGIYITNFGCGPDSFITHFFGNAMGEKPFLQIEIDEHSSDVGAITRLEAYLDSIKNAPQKALGPARPIVRKGMAEFGANRIVYIPYMTDHAYALEAAFKASGVNAKVLPRTTHASRTLGRRFTSGRECYPCALTTGDMLAVAQSDGFDPDKSAFFMPSGSGPCRFGQYNRFHRLVLDEAGFENAPIYAPDQDHQMYKELGVVGKTFVKLGWRGVLAIDYLQKALVETRPYAVSPDKADECYKKYLDTVLQRIEEGQEDIFPVLEEARAAFDAVERSSSNSRPRRRHCRGNLHPVEFFFQRAHHPEARIPRRGSLAPSHLRMAPVREQHVRTPCCGRKAMGQLYRNGAQKPVPAEGRAQDRIDLPRAFEKRS